MPAFSTKSEVSLKEAANSVQTAVRTVDAAKEQFGQSIDAAKQSLENQVDDVRAGLRQHGSVAGQVLSGAIGFTEGLGDSLYDAGKGLVQLANGAASLTSPVEWAADPQANIARLKSAGSAVETLGRLANLANPNGWLADPQGNAQLAGALWHSAATSFDQDPSKFTGNVIGTIGTMLIPGADARRGSRRRWPRGRLVERCGQSGRRDRNGCRGGPESRIAD
jgi:hypothetical protein